MIALTGWLAAAPASAAFIENLSYQTPAVDGYAWNGTATEATHRGPVLADNKIFLAYMANGACFSCARDIVAMMYDYNTGAWTRSVVDTVPWTGNDGHNGPSLYVNPSGHLEVYYGGIACSDASFNMGGGPGKGPCYKVASAPYSISAWGPRQSATLHGNNYIGGFTPDGTLHLFGELQYARRSPSGVWSGPHRLVQITSGNIWGTPGAIQDIFIKGSQIHFVWSPYDGNGGGRRLYHMKSKDGGLTWTNMAETQSFSHTSGGLAPAGYIVDAGWPDPKGYPYYPASFTIHTGNEGGNPEALILDDGTAAVVDGMGFRFWKWADGAWTSAPIGTSGGFETAANVLSNGTIVVHANAGDGTYYNILEYTSANRGATWTKSTIKAKGAENKNLALEAVIGAPPGQKERIILQWSARFDEGASTTHSKVAVLDRAIGPVLGAGLPPPVAALAPSAPKNARILR